MENVTDPVVCCIELLRNVIRCGIFKPSATEDTMFTQNATQARPLARSAALNIAENLRMKGHVVIVAPSTMNNMFAIALVNDGRLAGWLR